MTPNVTSQRLWTWSLGNKPLCKQQMWLLITEVQSECLELVTERHHYNACPIYVCCCCVRPVLFFIVKCGIACFLCACMLNRRSGIILTPRLPVLCQISFLSCPPTAALACGEKLDIQSITHSVTHPAYLICRKPKLTTSEYYTDWLRKLHAVSHTDREMRCEDDNYQSLQLTASEYPGVSTTVSRSLTPLSSISTVDASIFTVRSTLSVFIHAPIISIIFTIISNSSSNSILNHGCMWNKIILK